MRGSGYTTHLFTSPWFVVVIGFLTIIIKQNKEHNTFSFCVVPWVKRKEWIIRMKSSFQKSNFLYYGIILVPVLVEVGMIWQLESLVPLLYPGFIGFLVFHLLYHLLLFLVAKRSGRIDYLMIWGLFLMFNLLYDSFLGLLFLGLSFGMWCVFGKYLLSPLSWPRF